MLLPSHPSCLPLLVLLPLSLISPSWDLAGLPRLVLLLVLSTTTIPAMSCLVSLVLCCSLGYLEVVQICCTKTPVKKSRWAVCSGADIEVNLYRPQYLDPCHVLHRVATWTEQNESLQHDFAWNWSQGCSKTHGAVPFAKLPGFLNSPLS